MDRTTAIFRRNSFSFLLLALAVSAAPAQPALDSLALGRIWLEKGAVLLGEGRYDSALGCFIQAEQLLKELDVGGGLSVSNGIARVLVVRGRVDSAEGLLRRAYSSLPTTFDRRSLAVAETYASFAYFCAYHDQPDSALLWNSKSLDIRRSILGDYDPLLSRNYYASGLARTKQGRHQEAAEDLRQALRLYADCETASAQKAEILMLLGNALRECREYGEAIQFLDSSLVVLRSLDMTRSYPMLMGMIYSAFCHAKNGELALALSLYDSSASLAKSLFPDNLTVLSSIRTSMGQVYAELGDFERALEAYDDALERTKSSGSGSISGTATIHHYMAQALMEKGDSSLALAHAMQAFQLRVKTFGPDHPDVSTAHEVLADIKDGMGRKSDALTHLREAIRIRSLQPGGAVRPDCSLLTLKMARILGGMGDQAGAEAEVARVMREERGAGRSDPVCMAGAYEELADIRSRTGAYAESVSLYDTAMSELFRDGDATVPMTTERAVDLARGRHYLRLLQKKGAILEKQEYHAEKPITYLEEALRTYTAACRVIISIRSRYECEGSTFRLLEQFSETCERGIRVALRLRDLTHDDDYLVAAIAFAEHNKAGILLEGIRESRVREFAGVPRDLIDREHALRTRLTAREIELSKALEQPSLDSATVRDLRGRILSLREESRLVTEELHRAYPSYSRLFEPDPIPVVDLVQRSLDNETLVLEYFLGDDTAYLFLIGKERLDVRILPSPAKITAAATALTRAIRMVDYEGFASSARDLYSTIIAPAGLSIEGYTRLVVVPDKCLSDVPFEALVRDGSAGQGARPDFSSLPYLIRSHEITVSPSARLYCESATWRGTSTPTGGTFAGFAPVFRESTGTGVILASNRFTGNLDTTQLRSISVDGKRFRELPFSDMEVKAVAAEFSKQGLPSRTFTNESASEENFKQQAPLCSYLHVATHGFVNARDPGRSALLFAQPSDTTRGEDGVLYAAEAYNLHLNADLVVLSSCESGVGRFVNGEGVYALMRGFMYSGARNIIYSLWQVMDNHTSELMKLFYEGVLSGSRFGKALQMAKIRMLSKERTAFPFCWAGFVLVGR